MKAKTKQSYKLIPHEVEAFHFQRAIERVLTDPANRAAFKAACANYTDKGALGLIKDDPNGKLLAGKIREAYEKTK